MNPSQKFRNWFLRRGALAVFFVVVILLAWLQIWLNKPAEPITHTLASSTQFVEMRWLRQDDFSNLFATDDMGVVFTMPLSQDNLIAIDVISGNTMWEMQLSFEQSGPSGILVDKGTIFTVNAIRADAYEAATGKHKWSTDLGDGHVSVIPQLDSGLFRVYYGEELFEINPETGQILTKESISATAWVIENMILQASSNNYLNYLIASDRSTGELLWTNARMYYFNANQKPIDIGEKDLIVGFGSGICMLNLQTGEYDWCRPEIDINKIAIDYQSGIGYGMREDLVLLTIDLQTGNVLGETKFLSSRPIDEQIGSVSAIAFSNGVVVISFSDSGQTFGLRIENISRSNSQ